MPQQSVAAAGAAHTGQKTQATLMETLFEGFAKRAAGCTLASVTIGLGYSAVETTDGHLGLSYTMAGGPSHGVRRREYRDLDGARALDVLEYVRSADTLERSLGMALVNALNEQRASTMTTDAAPGGVFMRDMAIGLGTRVAMVGFFPPVVARLRAAGAEVSVLDRDREMGNEAQFLRDIAEWPDVLIITATSILNASFELFMDSVGPGTRVLVLGPTTPMVPEAFGAFPVTMLGGMVAHDHDRVMSAVRQAALTPALQRHCRKVYWSLGEA